MPYVKRAGVAASLGLGLAGLAVALTPNGNTNAHEIDNYNSQPVAVYGNKLELDSDSPLIRDYGLSKQEDCIKIIYNGEPRIEDCENGGKETKSFWNKEINNPYVTGGIIIGSIIGALAFIKFLGPIIEKSLEDPQPW